MFSKATIICENEEMLKDICKIVKLSGKYDTEGYDVPKENLSIAFIKRTKNDQVNQVVPEFIKEYVSKMSSINSSLKLVQFMADQYSKEKGDPGKCVRECKSIEEFAKYMKLMIDPIIKQTELGGE